MDTDELSNETYEAVILTAERFNHDLTLQFGCLASKCKSDNDYLLKAEQMTKRWLKYKYFDDLMDDIFFRNPPKRKDFEKSLSDILLNINKVRQIPMKKRTFEF